jgi:hypothetical protein
MAEETQQEGQKTLVAFIVGLLIGGLLVWAFSGPSANAPDTTVADEETNEEVSTDESEDESDDSEG